MKKLMMAVGLFALDCLKVFVAIASVRSASTSLALENDIGKRR